MLKPEVPAGPSRAVPRDTARGAPPAPTSRNGTSIQPLRVVQSSSLAMLVQRELERSILAGELVAGSKLNEATIAAALGVSRGPVREAFRALEESGLVRLEKNRGVFVRQVSVEEADEIYELRAVLDDYAGRRVAERIRAAEVRELRTLLDGMDAAAARNDLDGYHDANLAFHDRLVELAGNRKLLAMYRRLVNELRLHRRASIAQAGALPVSTREHHDIVDKIAAGAPAAAGRALHDHVMGSRERMHRLPPPAVARSTSVSAAAASAARRRR